MVLAKSSFNVSLAASVFFAARKNGVRFNTMETNPSNLTLDVVKQAIDLAIKCVSTGETLVPFILTEGDPGEIHSLVGDTFSKVLEIAQKQIDSFGIETKAFAFAYDGFITLQGIKNDCIYIEAAEISDGRIFMFGQQYCPMKDLEPIECIGNWMYLKQGKPKLKFQKTEPDVSL